LIELFDSEVPDLRVKVHYAFDETGNKLIREVDGFSTDVSALAVVRTVNRDGSEHPLLWEILHRPTRMPIAGFHTLWGARACANALDFFNWRFSNPQYFNREEKLMLKQRILAKIWEKQEWEIAMMNGEI
jgi:hypothetical protein